MLIKHRAISILEILVTIFILAFAILGLGNMQMKLQITQQNAYQRAQAIMLIDDINNRILANRTMANDYVTTNILGTGDTQPNDCSNLAIGAANDLCEWSNALKGKNEKNGQINSGGISEGRGCIELLQSSNNTPGICTPAIYRISVAWQGVSKLASSSLSCGRGLYGNDAYRRVITRIVTIGLPAC